MIAAHAATQRPVIETVIVQHVESAGLLWGQRSLLLGAPHARLHHLRRFDDRLAAHLDGLAIAGGAGLRLSEAALETPLSGFVFVVAVCALEQRDEELRDRLIALAQTNVECARGLRSAFGWVDAPVLRGVVASLLASADPYRRALALAASGMHRVDPGLALTQCLDNPDPLVRARAYRLAGELGKREFLSRLGSAVKDEDPICRGWASWSAVLLGDRHAALNFLTETSLQENPFRARALQAALLAMPLVQAHEHLRAFSADPAKIRCLVRGAGLAGDPTYVPWLIKQMSDDKLARLAGEAIALITGADLAALDLERKTPEGLDSGPNDDPNDANVEMDEDDDLPWPDVERIERWWAQNGSRFQQGQRYFVGAPVTRQHCIEVLRTGYQRQRILAAHHLCLLEPGSVLFEWRAPAWRQAQALAALA